MTNFPPHDYSARRDRVRHRLAELEVDRLLVTDPANVRYLSGFTGTNGEVIVAATASDDRLITDPRYEQRAATETSRCTGRGIRVVIGEPERVSLEGLAGGVLAAEADHLSWARAERLRERAEAGSTALCALRGTVEAARIVKDAAELARLERACALTTAAMTWLFRDVVQVGRTERELATALERRFVDEGADGIAFPSIVASGPNTAVPHHEPSTRPLAPGDLLTVDCGALVDGYHADCTRTIAVSQPAGELRKIHDAVRNAQAAGRAAVHAGATGGDVDAAARGVIAAAGYAQGFVHGTGHGVGLAIHEAPAVAHNATDNLSPQTPLTVEPGVYVPGISGVRIEDTVVVSAHGEARCLTDIPRHLIVT